MTRCLDYWKKFRKEGDFCGLKESTVYLQDQYLGLVEDMVNCGLDETTILKKFSLSAYTSSGFRGLKRDTILWRNTVDWLFKQLSSGKQVTVKKMRGFIGIDGWSEDVARLNLNDAALRGFLAAKKKNEHLATGVFAQYVKAESLPALRGMIRSVCNKPQIAVLTEMQKQGYGDNDYSAFCYAIKWARERLEAEMVAKRAQP